MRVDAVRIAFRFMTVSQGGISGTMSCTHFNDAGRTGRTDVPVHHTREQHHEGCAFANATGSAEKRTRLTTGKRLARLNQAAGLLGPVVFWRFYGH